MKQNDFFSASIPWNHNNPISHNGLIGISMVLGQSAEFFAPLDEEIPSIEHRWIKFDESWNEVIFVDRERRTVTRSELVRFIANKDGGAHVDPLLQEIYADLSRGNSLGWT
ncbi:MAG: hypothetical protein HQ477_09690 [Chloroflexi bacterium]|nr:hypothetical protein [Chloroflexota bacterium]